MKSESQPFDYSFRLDDPVRDDLVAAHRHAWQRLAEPGTWWTGAERVAIASEVRSAHDCGFCLERKQALSPFAVDGSHDVVTGDQLPTAAIDAVHRIVTDATRLSKTWIAGLADQGVPPTHYVELLSVVVSVQSIDAFHRALAIALEPLPTPATGDPSRRLPETLDEESAWVPMLPNRKPPAEYADLWPGPAPYVIRAMSLVPEAVRWLKELSSAQYLDMDTGEMFDFVNGKGPLSRAQTELIAGRVSAINECFY
jgi:hypothetical protein